MKGLNIIVIGTLASDPYAGMAWMHMQIVVGLKRLGHNVYYFETTSTWPHNPEKGIRENDPHYALNYLKEVTSFFGIPENWAYRTSYAAQKIWYGLPEKKAEALLREADLVLNVSAATLFKEEGLETGPLIYFGTDPVYHEIKFSQGDKRTKEIVSEHEKVVTYGENIGKDFCPIPPLPNLVSRTRQPILMDMWKNNELGGKKFTTVGNWKQEGRDLIYNGETYYWSKHHEFLKFLEVPLKVKTPIEVAMNLARPESIKHGKGTEVGSMGVATSDYDLLQNNGWILEDAPSFTTTPSSYRNYIIKSYGEFSFAKDQNIRMRSGWFSERSACYLAAGKPVITQDTGFNNVIPTGEGLFSFNTYDEILYAFDSINSNYQKHHKAALEIANEYFNSEKVLTKLIEDLS